MMDRQTEPLDQTGARALGHVALNYRGEADGVLAARLLELMGFRRLQVIPLGNGAFYQFLVDDARLHDGVGTIYLGPLSEPARRLYQAIGEALKVGREGENPVVASYKTDVERNPEANPHFGVMLDSLEDMEAIVNRIVAAQRSDPDLAKRVALVVNRAKPGDPDIDRRMAQSEIFSQTDRHCYGRFGCQVFVLTDLLVGGVLGEGFTIELDHVFPGHPENMFNKTELA